MTDSTIPPGVYSPHLTLTRLVDRHGTWATIRALVRVLVRRRRRRPAIVAVPDRLRRDVGLPERDPGPPPLRDLWQ